MSPEDRRALFDDLLHGRTSRNRELDRFAQPECRSVLRGYRRVKALVRELGRPGVEVQWVGHPEALAVAVTHPRLRYRRVVFLSPWEARFLASLPGPAQGFVSGAPEES
ncbi:MAG: hypothetical protein AB1578_00625 [Thermodesulfobacteriota bacterium]